MGGNESHERAEAAERTADQMRREKANAEQRANAQRAEAERLARLQKEAEQRAKEERNQAERARREAEEEAQRMARFARSEAEKQAAEAARARAEAQRATERALKIQHEKEAAEREAALLKAEKEAEEEKARQKPWREIPGEYTNWDEKTLLTVKSNLKTTVKKNKIGGTLIRILLVGDTGAGKSSLINSMNAALSGYYAQLAMTTARDHTTKEYHEYPLYNWGDDESSEDSSDDDSDSEEDDKDDDTLPFLICDFRGYGTKAKGVADKAVEAALQGIVENNAKVDNESRLSDFKREIDPQNMLTYLGIVVNSTLVHLLGTKDEPYHGTLDSIHKAIEFASDNHMPVFAFLTMCDMLDADVAKHTERLYHSRPVEKAVRTAESKLGININQIVPVMNFTNQMFVAPQMALQFLFPLHTLLIQVKASLTTRRKEQKLQKKLDKAKAKAEQKKAKKTSGKSEKETKEKSGNSGRETKEKSDNSGRESSDNTV